MSSIVFEGNTYTFGATVSANPGTGTTSYVFGGLSSGWTYGFIIWAFNGFGPSSIVGPVNYSTSLVPSPETRNSINAFYWAWPADIALWRYSYTTGSETNLFYDSENLGPSNWFPYAFVTPSGITLPNGYTSGKILTVLSGYNLAQQTATLPVGATYIVSWYQNNNLGCASTDLMTSFYAGGASDTQSFYQKQILPQEGTGAIRTVISPLLGPTGGQSGWIRYAIEIAITPSTSTLTGLPLEARNIFFNFRIADKGFTRIFYFGAPQLELVE